MDWDALNIRAKGTWELVGSIPRVLGMPDLVKVRLTDSAIPQTARLFWRTFNYPTLTLQWPGLMCRVLCDACVRCANYGGLLSLSSSSRLFSLTCACCLQALPLHSASISAGFHWGLRIALLQSELEAAMSVNDNRTVIMCASSSLSFESPFLTPSATLAWPSRPKAAKGRGRRGRIKREEKLQLFNYVSAPLSQSC